MKKNFFKKMSVVLALALTVSAVAPAATQATAAAAPAFKSASVTVNVGQTKNYGMKNVTPWSVKKFVTGNKKVATVAKSGKTAKVTGVAEGSTVLRADLKAYKSKRTLQVRIPVTVKSSEKGLVKVTQTAIKKLELTFGAEESLKDLTKEDVIIIRSGDNQKMYVKEVKTDGKVLKVETLLDMTDKNVFTVTVGARSLQFTATDGIIVDLKINTTQIQYDKATMITLIATDGTGVELNAMDYNYNGVSNSNYEFSIDTTEGYITSDNKLVLNEVGNTAKVKGVYHTWKYDSNGIEEGKIEREYTVTAVAKAVVGSYEKYTVAGSKPGDWATATLNHDLIVGENDYFFMLAKDSAGDDVVNGNPQDSNYTVHSSNEDIFFVNGNRLYGNKAGLAYVVVKDLDGKTIWTMPITVKDTAKAKTLELSASSVSVTNSTLAAATVKVDLTTKDNYGRKMDDVGAYDITCLSAPNNAAKANATVGNAFSKNASDIVFYGTESNGTTTSITKGTYTYQIKLTQDDANFVRIVTVNVQEPVVNSSVRATYKLIINGVAGAYTYDTAIASGNTGDKDITVQLGDYRNNILYQYVELTQSAVIGCNGGDGVVTAAEVGKLEAATTPSAKVATFAAMTVDGITKKVAKADAKTYTIEVKNPDNALGTIKQNVIIKDSTPIVTFTKRATLIDGTDVTSAAMTAYVFKIGSNTLEYNGGNPDNAISLADVIEVKTNGNVSGNKVWVDFAKFYAPINVDGVIYKVPVKVDIKNYVEVD